MKIAFFTDSYYPMLNGVTISVANLASELRALGHTVYIFAPKFDNYIDTDKNVYRLKSFKVLDSEPAVHMPFLLPHHYLTEIQPRDFDIVHAHGNGFFSLLGYQMAKVKGTPYLLTFHTQLTRYMHYVFNGKLITPAMAARGLRISANICDTVITPSEKMKKELVTFGTKKPIKVIPNFVYADKFITSEKNYLHELCHIPRSSPILLTVGRMGKEKNFPFLLRAFKKVTEQESASHLVIVGHGEESENIKSYAKELGLGERIHFTGKILQSDIPKVYADSDIFLFSSTSEVHPMVVLEAASAGLPFVVVKDDAYKNAIINGENGYQVVQQVNQFAKKVIELLEDKQKRVVFGMRSQEIVKDSFDPQTLAKSLVKIYEQNLREKKPRRISLKRLNTTGLRRLYHSTQILDKIFE